MTIDDVYRLMAAGITRRVDIRRNLGVHRNTWRRKEAKWVAQGAMRRVGRYHLHAPDSTNDAPRSVRTIQVDAGPKALSSVSESELAGLIDQLESALSAAKQMLGLLHNGASNASEVVQPAPPNESDCTEDAPKVVQPMHQNAPECTKSGATDAPKVVHSSRAPAGFLSPAKNTSCLRQAGNALARETPPEKSLRVSMKEFRTVWRRRWRERFPELKDLPSAHLLGNGRAFVEAGLDEISVEQFGERLDRFFNDRKAIERHWPVGFFFSGIHEDYAVDDEVEEPITVNETSAWASQKEPKRTAKELPKAEFPEDVVKFERFMAQIGL